MIQQYPTRLLQGQEDRRCLLHQGGLGVDQEVRVAPGSASRRKCGMVMVAVLMMLMMIC